MKNKCTRCAKAERFGRVFECIEHGGKAFHLCVECAQILYKAADAKKDADTEKAAALYNEFVKDITSDAGRGILLPWVFSLDGKTGDDL